MVGSEPVPTPLARIFFSEGSYHLENRGKPAEVQVDGTPVDGRRTLDRLHVIELSGGFELVFNRAPAARAPDPPPSRGAAPVEGVEEPSAPAEAAPPTTPSSQPPSRATEPPPPAASRAPDSPPQAPDPAPRASDSPPHVPDPPRSHPGPSGKGELPPDQDPGRTVLDMAGFGSLPQLPEEEAPPPEPPDRGPEPPSADTAPPAPPEPPVPSDQDPGRTVLDMAGFGSLPDLEEATKPEGETNGPEGTQEDEGGATKEARKADPIQESPREPSRAADQDPGRTVLDMAGFGALPDVSGGDAPSGAEETVEAPSPRPPRSFQLSVDVPGRGPMTFPLASGDNTVGRGEDCDITVFDPERWLSRKHAVVRIHDDGVEVIDLKGVNGTFIGGERIDRAPLTPGSSFSLGPNLKFTLQER